MTTRRVSSSGFSFVELLFAMAVLSFGTIGVVAVMYVGLGQTVATVDETAAATVARQGAAVMGQMLSADNTTGKEFATLSATPTAAGPSIAGTAGRNNPVPSSARSAFLCDGDRRFAWVPIVRRSPTDPTAGGPASPTADVLIAVLRASARSEFTAADLAGDALMPQPISLTLSTDPAMRQTTAVLSASTPDLEARLRQVVTEGACVVITAAGRAQISNRTVIDPLVGQTLRLAERTGPDTWTVDTSGLPRPLSSNYDAYLFGRGRADPVAVSKGWAGDAQCVAVYATTVLLR